MSTIKTRIWYHTVMTSTNMKSCRMSTWRGIWHFGGFDDGFLIFLFFSTRAIISDHDICAIGVHFSQFRKSTSLSSWWLCQEIMKFQEALSIGNDALCCNSNSLLHKSPNLARTSQLIHNNQSRSWNSLLQVERCSGFDNNDLWRFWVTYKRSRVLDTLLPGISRPEQFYSISLCAFIKWLQSWMTVASTLLVEDSPYRGMESKKPVHARNGFLFSE